MNDSVVLTVERRKRPSNRDALIVFALALGPPRLPTAHSSLGGRLIPRQSVGGHDQEVPADL